MKQLLNKKLHVKYVLAFVIVPLAVVIIILALTLGKNPVISPAKIIEGKIAPEVKPKAAPDTSAMGILLAYADSLSKAGQLFGGSWSFNLSELASGKSLCAINIDHGLSPASVMKVVTTGTALSLLGPSFRFSTLLQYDGTMDSTSGANHKILKGNIIIKGGGDPSLGSETFGSSIDAIMKEWAAAIKKLGIDSIAGNIIGDAQSYDANPVPEAWAWEDMQCDYGTGPCGLNIHENVFDLLVTPAGRETRVKITPPIPGLKLYNEIIHNPTIPRSYIYVVGAPFQFERTAMGEVSTTMQGRSAIPDPALFCAQRLKSELRENGIGVRDTPTTLRLLRLNHKAAGKAAEEEDEANDTIPHKNKNTKRSGRHLIMEHLSPSLAELVYHTNQVSQNFYAESILRALAWKMNGYGSETGGVDIIYRYWRSKGLDLRGICMVDGCGLARMNSVTTHQLVEMLRDYARDTAMYRAFYKSLPIAGETGTIRKLADGTEAEGNLRAKSGTMARVKSYAGYVKTRSGKPLAFAMIANNTLWSEVELSHIFERLFVLMARLP